MKIVVRMMMIKKILNLCLLPLIAVEKNQNKKLENRIIDFLEIYNLS